MVNGFESAAAAGYDLSIIRRCRRSVLIRRIVRLTPYLLACAIFAGITANYLERLPRERAAAGYSTIQRIVYGGKLAWRAVWAKMSMPSGSVKQSPLPKMEVQIQGTKLDELNANLPASGKVAYDGYLKVNGELHKAALRYRGDSMNHWAFPQKSWRVVLSKGDSINGIRTFNLYLPRTQNQITDYLGYEFARRLGGLLVPDAYPIQFRLNRRFDGTRLFLEQVDADFGARRGLPPGKVFIGDTTTEGVYGHVERARLFDDATGWATGQIGFIKRLSKAVKQKPHEITRLISVLASSDPYQLREELPKVIDIESTLRYMALLDIAASIHIDNTHNQKWFLDTTTGKLRPIVWDIAAYFWPNSPPLDLAANRLFQRILEVPEFRERKNQIIWEALTGPLSSEEMLKMITDTEHNIESDTLLSPFKLRADSGIVDILTNKAWRSAVANLKQYVPWRNRHIAAAIADTKATYWTDTNAGVFSLWVRTDMDAGVRIPSISLTVDARDGTPVIMHRDGFPFANESNFAGQAVVKNGRADFQIDDTLMAARTTLQSEHHSDRLRKLPGIYRYFYEVQGAGRITGVSPLSAANSITGKTFTMRETPADRRQNSLSSWWNPGRYAPKAAKVLEGNVNVDQTLVLFSDVEIKPGTHIKIAPKASLLVQGGRIIAAGTAESPITIAGNSADAPGGAFAVQESPHAEFSHVRFANLTAAAIGDGIYPAGVTVSRTDASFSDCSFSDLFFASNFATVNVTGGDFGLPEKTAFLVRGERPHTSGVAFASAPVILPAAAGEKEYGQASSARKVALFAIANDWTGKTQAADLLRSSLTRLVGDNGWQLPSLIGKSYRVSPISKPESTLEFYFDDARETAAQKGISYRVQFQFDRPRCMESFLFEPHLPSCWPQSFAFIQRQVRSGTANELREITGSAFESSPAIFNSIPIPEFPWSVPEFMLYAQRGRLRNIPLLPARLLQSQLGEPKLALDPVKAVQRINQRIYIEANTPWGGDTYPSRTIMVNVDSIKEFPVDALLRITEPEPNAPNPDLPEPSRRVLEVSAELDPDVAERLAAATGEAADDQERARLRAVRAAFDADTVRAARAALTALGGKSTESWTDPKFPGAKTGTP